MGLFHTHEWKQVEGVFRYNKKNTQILGIYFYCINCTAVHARDFNNCLVYSYEKVGDDKNENT